MRITAQLEGSQVCPAARQYDQFPARCELVADEQIRKLSGDDGEEGELRRAVLIKPDNGIGLYLARHACAICQGFDQFEDRSKILLTFFGCFKSTQRPGF